MQPASLVRSFHLCLVVILVSFAAVTPANGSPITYRFSGQVTWQPNAVIDPAAKPGERFEGFFLADPGGINRLAPASNVALFDSSSQLIGIRFDSGYSVRGPAQVFVSHDWYGSTYGAVTPISPTWTALDGLPVAGFLPMDLSVWFVSSGVPLGATLSPSATNLASYPLRSMQLDFGRALDPATMLFYPVYGEIDRVWAVPEVVTPEPSTWLLLATGLGGVLRKGSRRRQAGGMQGGRERRS